MCVCHRGNPVSRWTGDFWSKSISLVFFANSMIVCDLKIFQVFGSLQTSLEFIMEELSGGGSVAVAVRISDR